MTDQTLKEEQNENKTCTDAEQGFLWVGIAKKVKHA